MNITIRQFQEAQKRALKKGAQQGKSVSEFEALLRKEIARIKKEDAVKAEMMREMLFGPRGRRDV